MRDLWRLKTYLRPYRKIVALALLVMAVSGGLSAFALVKTQPVFAGIFGARRATPEEGAPAAPQLTSEEANQAQLDEVLHACVRLAIILVLASFADGAAIYLGEYVGQHLLLELRRHLFNHFQTLSMSFYDAHRSGELISRVSNDTNILQRALGANLAWIVVCPVAAVGMTARMVAISWKLTLGLAIIVPVVTVVTVKLGMRIRFLSRRVQEKLEDMTTVLHEAIAAARIIKIFGMQRQAMNRFDQENRAVTGTEMKAAVTRGINSPIVGIMVGMAMVGILLFGAREIQAGNMGSDGLMTFVILLQGLASQVNRLARINLVMQRAAAAATRHWELLEHEERLPVVENPVRLEKLEGRITFENVSFSYGERLPAIQGVSLEVAPGEVVAVAGPSGAGKTTIANLIPRLYDADEGRVLIDGIDVREMDPQSLRSHMSLVPQETLLFADSIRENIAYAYPEATEEEIIQAAKTANAHEFIMQFPKGYDTTVGERGAQLSGGQRQRIAIARAVLRDPAILILDEATSALDRESERAVHTALQQVLEGRTAVIIAHRLSTIRNANRIIVLDSGRIVEIGTHDELMSAQGLYAQLYQAREKN